MAHVVLGELIENLVEASQRMKARNPHKLLLLQAADVLMQMGHKINDFEEAEAKREREQSRIVLVN